MLSINTLIGEKHRWKTYQEKENEKPKWKVQKQSELYKSIRLLIITKSFLSSNWKKYFSFLIFSKRKEINEIKNISHKWLWVDAGPLRGKGETMTLFSFVILTFHVELTQYTNICLYVGMCHPW